MKRNIVVIDESKCNGCGQCVHACAEGALQLVNGKAKLVSDVYCDGLGACIGDCPMDAITVEEREANAFDEKAVEKHLAAKESPKKHDTLPCGCPSTEIKSFAKPAHKGCPGTQMKTFQKPAEKLPCGCPSTEMKSFDTNSAQKPRPVTDVSQPSLLGHWPVQLKLVPPHAPFLKGAHLVVAADCTAYACGDFHARYLDGRSILIGCPKLDDIAYYQEKLKAVIAEAKPASITVVRMEVPCCSGIANAVVAARDAVAPGLPVHIHIVGTQGEISEKVV